ncbi:MAG: TIM44-like domain-containing protein [Bacilli bacterium]|nr:TIM44-like domain-containing protein [Bacilli bacterium]
MKNKVLKIIFSFLLAITLISPFTVSNTVKADIGFDGGYDGGYDSGGSDWGGGSSWDDDDDDDYYYSGGYNNGSYSGGGGSADIGTMLLALFICGLAVGVPLTIVWLLNREMPNKSSVPLVDTSWMSVDEDLNMQAYLMYKELNDAWMKKDLEPVRHLLTDEMYNMYLMQLDTLIEKGETNIMKDYFFISGHISSKRKYKGKETIVMIFRIRCKDYIIDDRSKKVVRGKATDVIDYTYEFKLVRNVEPKTIICPSCGSEIKNEEGVICSHCGTVVHTNTNTLRLADKKVLRQTRSRR